MRSDQTNLILGLRVNTRVTGLIFLASAVALLALNRAPASLHP